MQLRSFKKNNRIRIRWKYNLSLYEKEEAMGFICVKDLSKAYIYYEKDIGFKSTFKNLFFREKLVKEAVKNISFEVEKGEAIAFIGPNGAGKTTTLKMLSGILYPDAGEINVNGYIPWERKEEFKRQVSIIMGQKTQLWWDLPANESFYLNKCIYDIDDKIYKRNLDDLCELLSVGNLLKKQVRRLSLGERMKMELIAGLLHDPAIIFLDEPTIGMDINSQRIIREFLKKYNKIKNNTILLTSHHMTDIESICEKAIIINKGKIAYDGYINKINSKAVKMKRIKLKFDKSVDKRLLEEIGVVKEYSSYNAEIEIEIEKLPQRMPVIIEKLPIRDFTVEDIPIEDLINDLCSR